MKLTLCVRLTQWPIDRFRRSRQTRRDRSDETPLVLVRTVASRQLVVCASRPARLAGIRSGMTLAQARALRADVDHADHEPHLDTAALDKLARYCQRFSPMVTIIHGHDEDDPPAPGQLPAYGLYLDATGVERLHGGPGPLMTLVGTQLARLGLTCRLAVAPNPAAAWALTFAPAPVCLIDPTHLRDALAPLPVRALRLPETLESLLLHLGVDTIATAMKLPRDQLPARFGPMLHLRLDQALGQAMQALDPVGYDTPVSAQMRWDGKVDSLESLWEVFRRLIPRLTAELLRRGRGARHIRLTFDRPDNRPPLTRTIGLARPCRDARRLFDLFRCALETFDLGDGVCGVGLTVTADQPLAEQQLHLVGHDPRADGAALDHLIERLRLRLGDRSVLRPRLIEAHTPERAFRLAGVADDEPAGTVTLDSPRPLHLLPVPQEVRVMVAPSDDADGRPVGFSHADGWRRLTHALGPERLAGPWWQGNTRTRDYFDAEDPAGQRFWLFRVPETGRWYLHGVFE